MNRLETIKEIYEKIRIDLHNRKEQMEYAQSKGDAASRYEIGYFEGRFEGVREIRDIVGAMLDHELDKADI